MYAGPMTMIVRIFAAFLLVLVAGSPQFAAGKDKDEPGTQKEHSACSTDAARYCSDDIPNAFKVLACLKDHRAKLKKACRQVLEDHGE
jgi:hypothetical protein